MVLDGNRARKSNSVSVSVAANFSSDAQIRVKMSLSTLTPRLVSKSTLSRIILVRCGSTLSYKGGEQTLKLQDQGFFKYERDVSRDKRYSNPQKLGDTPARFLFRRLGHAYEIYPLYILTGLWSILFAYTVYYSFSKSEVWLDRSNTVAPWDWERIRENYWKKPTLVFDPTGKTHTRLEIMETLQDQMVAAAKERGTR